MITVLQSGKCVCDIAPMGDSGLEGFNEKETYAYDFCSMKLKHGMSTYYRVYHQQVLGEDPYYETCGVNTFKKFFKIIPNES